MVNERFCDMPPLRFPLLLVVADRDYVADDTRWLELVRELGAAARGESVAIQVRARQALLTSCRLLTMRARKVVPRGVPLLLNGDAALAASLAYEGVHWPGAETPTGSSAQRNLCWRSAAVHSVDAIRAAERAGTDFVVFGSVFEPGSKHGVAAAVEALGAAARATELPVIAIGGITPADVHTCLEAGAQGIAVVSGILGAASPVRGCIYLGMLTAHAMLATQSVQKGGRDDDEA